MAADPVAPGPPGTVRIIAVDRADDPRLADYREMRERDLVGRRGLFVAEGLVVVRALLRTPLHAPVSLLLADNRLEAVEPMLEAARSDLPVYVAPQAVLDGIVGFPMHRGVLGLGRRGPDPGAAALLGRLGPAALVVLLFGLGNHDNLGGVFRNAAAFGADAVLLDPTCCDPLYRKASRVSVGATLLTPTARLRHDEDPVALLADRDFAVLALSPRGETTLAAVRRSARTAVLLGAEGPGLPEAILQRAPGVRLPMAGGFDSLNVAVTSGIVLHHLTCVAPGPQRAEHEGDQFTPALPSGAPAPAGPMARLGCVVPVAPPDGFAAEG